MVECDQRIVERVTKEHVFYIVKGSSYFSFSGGGHEIIQNGTEDMCGAVRFVI